MNLASKNLLHLLLLCAFSLALTTACEKKEESYEDCIIRNVKASMNDYAVDLVERACKEKAQAQEEKKREDILARRTLRKFPEAAADKVMVELREATQGQFWTGVAHNNNQEWTVERITLEISPPPIEPKGGILSSGIWDKDKEPEQYFIDVEVPPLASRPFDVYVSWPSMYAWEKRILQVEGKK